MVRPDLRFNTPRPASEPTVDLSFSPQARDADEVIDLRDQPSLTDAQARAILGVAPDADWNQVRDAYARRVEQLTTQRYQINTAYATLRLLASR